MRRGRQLPAEDAAGGVLGRGGTRVLPEPVQRGVRRRLDHQTRLVLPLSETHVGASGAAAAEVAEDEVERLLAKAPGARI